MDLSRFKFVQLLELDRIEDLYKRLSVVNLDTLSAKNYYYVNGAIDALFAIIGCKNSLTKIIDLDNDQIDQAKMDEIINAATESFRAIVEGLEKDEQEEVECAGGLPEFEENTVKEEPDQ